MTTEQPEDLRRMTPAEFRCRIEAIGVSQVAAEDLFHVGKGQTAKWASGKDPIPYRVEDELVRMEENFDLLTHDIYDAIVDEMAETGGECVLTVWRTNAAFSAAHSTMAGYPAGFHRAATMRAISHAEPQWWEIHYAD